MESNILFRASARLDERTIYTRDQRESRRDTVATIIAIIAAVSVSTMAWIAILS